MDTFIHYGMAAAMQAVQDAGLPHGEALGEDGGRAHRRAWSARASAACR